MEAQSTEQSSFLTNIPAEREQADSAPLLDFLDSSKMMGDIDMKLLVPYQALI